MVALAKRYDALDVGWGPSAQTIGDIRRGKVGESEGGRKFMDELRKSIDTGKPFYM